MHKELTTLAEAFKQQAKQAPYAFGVSLFLTLTPIYRQSMPYYAVVVSM